MLVRLCCISMTFTMLMQHHGPARSTETDNRITELCLAGFNGAMVQSGIIPPDGMGRFTCDCFLSEVNKGDSIQWPTLLASIESAQNTCKKKAAERFKI